MNAKWDIAIVQQYITDGIQENLQLEYKGARAFENNSEKKKDIAIAISAMANSAGGIIIYGLNEFYDKDNRQLEIDPVDQIQFSKEWLEQVINSNIQPRIKGIVIYPILVENSQTQGIYVVEIPKSTTAHQANDKRYYKRYNFQRVAMEDYEIRDVMNRASTPDAEIEFGLIREITDAPPYVCRRLKIMITNKSMQVIDRFKLILRVKNIGYAGENDFHVTDIQHFSHNDDPFSYSYVAGQDENLDMIMVYQSKEVLFPNENIIIGGYRINWVFFDKLEWDDKQWSSDAKKENWIIEWNSLR